MGGAHGINKATAQTKSPATAMQSPSQRFQAQRNMDSFQYNPQATAMANATQPAAMPNVGDSKSGGFLDFLKKAMEVAAPVAQTALNAVAPGAGTALSAATSALSALG
jgi:hypothetical protein